MTYSFNQALSVFPLDAASDRPMVLCEVPAQRDSTIRFAIPADLLDLLRMFDGRKETAEVFETYNKLNPGKYSMEKVENLVRTFLVPKSLLVDRDVPAILPEISSKRAAYVYGKVRLIPRSVIYPVARAFSWAFKKPFLLLWLNLFVLAHLIFYFWIFPNHPMHLSEFTGSRFSTVMLLSLLAAFIHETGHASALVSFGCKQTEIGFGLYIYYPVLYTDVSEAWRLTRHQRAMIDIAGVYFQSVFQAAMLVLYLYTGSAIPLYTFLFNDLIMARTMNPFLRMDGYWLVADLFGIFNLREQSTKLLKQYFLKLFGSAAPKRVEHTLNRKARISLAVYSILSTAFFFYLCGIMIRLAIIYLIPTYPTRLLAVWQVIAGRPFDPIRLFSLIFEVLWRTAVLCGLSLFAFRIGQALWGLLRFLVQTLWQRVGNALRDEDKKTASVSAGN